MAVDILQPAENELLQRLGRRELRRRLYHMSPGLLPILLWVIPHKDPVSLLLQLILIGICLVLGATVYVRFRRISREGESGGAAVLGYAGSVTLAVLLFPQHLEFAMGTVAILAFGDGSATLAGLMWGKRPLPWNREKSWAGLATGFTCGFVMAAVYIYFEAQPSIPWSSAATYAAGAASFAAAAESLPLRFNDNARVGLAALAGIATIHWCWFA